MSYNVFMKKTINIEDFTNHPLYKRDPYFYTRTKTRNEFLIHDYVNFTATVEKLAIKYNISTRQLQRICKEAGVIRTIAEANKIAAPFKNYEGHRVPEHLKVKRKSLPQWVRYSVLKESPVCKMCGATAQTCPLQVDHIDNDPTNNDRSNLQVLCMSCNYGKAWENKKSKLGL